MAETAEYPIDREIMQQYVYNEYSLCLNADNPMLATLLAAAGR
jgi:hypothetical protein